MRFKTGDDRNSRIPPGGYRAYVSETDTEFGGTTADWTWVKRQMIDHVRGNRELFDIEDGDLDEWAETLICVGSRIESSHCNGEDTGYRHRVITIGDVLRFLRVVQKWIKKGFALVSQEEAERRAAICAGGGPLGTPCPYNGETQGCLGCANLIGVVMEKLGNRRTSVNRRLHNCGVCSCNLKALVFCPDEVIRDTSQEDEEYPAYCWKLSVISDASSPPSSTSSKPSPKEEALLK